jgi:rubrerythrin
LTGLNAFPIIKRRRKFSLSKEHFKGGGKTMDNSLGSVLIMAIDKEKEAHDFYMDLFNVVEDKEAKSTLRYLASEEAKHDEFLSTCREGRFCSSVLNLDLAVDNKIVEHLGLPDIKKNMKSAEVYLIAANRELNAYTFYKSLADSYPAGDVKDLLNKIANEEMKHKEKMEYLYSNTAFPQTEGG